MFKIINSNNAVMNYQINKEVAKPDAREQLKKRSGVEEVKSKDAWYKERLDWNEAAKNAKNYKKDYERTLPEKLSSEAQNAMWKKAKQLKDEFTIGMLTREELHPVKGFMDNGTMKYVVDEERMRSIRATERELAWNKKNETKITEFKNIMRHLDPDNPNAGDVERFRPRGSKGVG